MSGQTGRQFKMAMRKFTTNSWGVAASVTQDIYFETDGEMMHQPAQVLDIAFNQAFQGPADPGLIEAPDLSMQGRDRYEDYQYVLEALVMGSPTTVAISTSAAGQVTSWTHQFDLADSTDGLGVTIAIDMNQFVKELTSAKPYGFSIENDDNGGMNQGFKFLGAKVTNISSVNINSTLGGATYPALTNKITQQQGTFRMNVFSAGALGATDAQQIESLKFSFERGQDASNAFGQDFIVEPADNDWPDTMIEVTYPRCNTVSANSLFAGLRSSTAFKADLTFVGAFINSTDTYKKLYQWPYLQLDQDGLSLDTAGADQVKPKAKWKARLAPTSPTGMAFVRPFRLTRIQVNSVNAFA
jgi:hypothetical protein